jgi:2-methylisocitrate lyase-like PEP mutase family enzyme
VADNVQRCIAARVAGLSIEDATGIAEAPPFSLPEAVEHVRAARCAIDESGPDVLLTGRTECFLYGHPDPLAESIRWRQAALGVRRISLGSALPRVALGRVPSRRPGLPRPAALPA